MITKPNKKTKQMFLISKYTGKEKDEIVIYTASEKDCRHWINHIRTEQNKYFADRKKSSERFKVMQTVNDTSPPSLVMLVLDKEMGSISKMDPSTEKLISSYDVSKLISFKIVSNEKLLLNFFYEDLNEIVLNDHCFFVNGEEVKEIENCIQRMIKFRESVLQKKVEKTSSNLSISSSSNLKKKPSSKSRPFTTSSSHKKSTRQKLSKSSKISKILTDTQSHDPFDLSTDTSMVSALEQDYTSATTEFSRSLRKGKKKKLSQFNSPSISKKRPSKPRKVVTRRVGNTTFFMSRSMEDSDDNTDLDSDLITEEVIREYKKSSKKDTKKRGNNKKDKVLKKVLTKRIIIEDSNDTETEYVPKSRKTKTKRTKKYSKRGPVIIIDY